MYFSECNLNKDTMKNIILLLFILFNLKNTAQTAAILNVNNVNTEIRNNLSPFAIPDIGKSSYQMNGDSLSLPIFSTGLYLGASDSFGTTYISGQRFREGNEDSYTWGPIGNTRITNNFQDYNRVWKIRQQDIWSHQQGLGTSEAILNWPAHGDVANNEAFYLAPFVDVNHNGYYDPSQGDYPKIKGDEAVFFIMNDKDSTHSYSNTLPLGVEIHVMIYAFNSNVESVKNTVFVNYTIYNRSSIDYQNFIVNPNMDADLSCSGDDLGGCDSSRNVGYIYDDGSDATFGSFPCMSIFGDGNVMGIKVLNRSLNACQIFGDGSGIYSPAFYSPSVAYNLMQGLTPSGNSFIHPIGNFPTKFFYPNGEQEILNIDSSLLHIGDKRMFLSLEPISLPSNSSYCLDLAYLYYYDENVDRNQNVVGFLHATDTIQSFYDDVNLSCVGFVTGVETDNRPSLQETKVHPNPFVNETKFTFSSLIQEGKLIVYNSLGQIVNYISISNRRELVLERKHLETGIYIYAVFNQGSLMSKGKLAIE